MTIPKDVQAALAYVEDRPTTGCTRQERVMARYIRLLDQQTCERCSRRDPYAHSNLGWCHELRLDLPADFSCANWRAKEHADAPEPKEM